MVKVQKIIKKFGNTLGVYLTREEQRIYDLHYKDIIEIDFKKIGKAKW